jgi:hypothetical protein
MPSTVIAPAPWSLKGKGFVLLYHFSHAFNSQYGFMEDWQQQAYRGWLGAVLLVDYEASNVGPYQELLFMPGLFRLGGRLAFSISKIWVSTEASVWNGHTNWGIPKELAQFSIQQTKKGATRFGVKNEGGFFFDASIMPRGFSIPFTSKLVPAARIIQQKEQQLLLTAISARGRLQPASLQSIYAQPDFFPPVNRLRPLATLSVKDFAMQFPVAELVGTRGGVALGS